MPAPLTDSPGRGALALALAVVALALLAPASLASTQTPSSTAGTRGDAAVAASAIVPGSVNRSSIVLRASYDVDATLRYAYSSITTRSTIAITNTSGAGIDRLELNAVPARLGRLRLDYATVDGRAVSVTRSDQTLIVPLGGVLPADASMSLSIGYTAWFQTSTSGSNWLFAASGGIMQAYRWIPWVSREVDFDRPNFGDPFVTPVSPSVKVTIKTDRTMAIAATGRRTAVSGLVQTFEAQNVRDFNFTASPYYSTLRGTVGDTPITVYYRSGYPGTMLDWAKRSISRYESLVGAYPQPQFTIAQTTGGYGMESPALIWVPSSTSSASLPYLVAHETGHQWFYSTVGNDQPFRPFADEAITDFLARDTVGNRRSSRCATADLDRTIYEYSSSCYYEVIYIQGGNFINDLRIRMGNTAFWGAMRDYYARWSRRFGGIAQFLGVLDAHTPLDLVPSYHSRFPRYY